MASQIDLAIIIPAYNEEKRIERTVRSVYAYLANKQLSYEIIIVSDGSTDGTVRLIDHLIKETKNLRLIHHDINHGKGWVVRQGMLSTKAKIRLFMDADNATSIEHYDLMAPLFSKGYQVVIGSRDSKDAEGAKQEVSQNIIKRCLGNISNVLIQMIAVRGIWDTQCGFKALTAAAADDIFSRAKINRWGFDIEILLLAKKLGYSMAVIPVKWINDFNSKVKMSAYGKTFVELVQIRWWILKGDYNTSDRNER
jgi:dolichyl-phosphate beta-glucosyltransferase